MLLGGALVVRNGWAGFGAERRSAYSLHRGLAAPNLTGDPTREYIVDGMTDTLITELVQVVSVPVISRNSSMQYRGTQKRPPDIAQELNVEGIVQGAASMTGSTVRMNVQLIHAATDRYVWAKDYEREAKDVMALQAEVARDIATAIKNGETPASSPPASRVSDVSPEAYDLYAKALHARQRDLRGTTAPPLRTSSRRSPGSRISGWLMRGSPKRGFSF